MRNFTTALLVGALAFMLSARIASAAEAPASGPDQPTATAGRTLPGNPVAPVAANVSAVASPGAALPSNNLGQPPSLNAGSVPAAARPENILGANRALSPGAQISEAARRMIEEAKRARAEFLKQKRDLQLNLSAASTREARAQLRAQLRENQARFLEQQLKVRDEMKEQIALLKDRLREHQELMEEAQKESRGKPRKEE
jgi:hypothetical protein